MGRPLRIEYPGAVYHVTTRGDNKEIIFADDFDRHEYLRLLNRAKKEQGIKLFGYCLMSNHTHLCLQVENVPLSKVMHSLNHLYALYFNQRHGRVGHLFQERYFAKVCLDDQYLLTMIAYIDWNPVHGGLVSDPKDYPWSSHREYLGHGDGIADLEFIRAMFADAKAGSAEAYRQFILGVGAEKASDNEEDSAWKAHSDYINRLCRQAAELTRIEFSSSWENIIGSSRDPKIAEARAALAYLLTQKAGLSITEVAQVIGKTTASVSIALSRPGLKEKMDNVLTNGAWHHLLKP